MLNKFLKKPCHIQLVLDNMRESGISDTDAKEALFDALYQGKIEFTSHHWVKWVDEHNPHLRWRLGIWLLVGCCLV